MLSPAAFIDISVRDRSICLQIISDNNRTSCRVSNRVDRLDHESFRSAACADCLYYIYLTAHPTYQIERCTSGLLICEMDNTVCDCDNTSRVYNIDAYGHPIGAFTSITQLQLRPPLPIDFVVFIEECCDAADKCCQRMLQHNDQGTARYYVYYRS
jgi:hypothetical protein